MTTFRRRKRLPRSIERSLPFLRILVKAPKGKKHKAKLLEKFPKYVTNDVIEILYNVVMGNLHITPPNQRKLKKHEKQILYLLNLSNLEKRRKYLYKQKGGFLASVIPLIASLVGGVATSLMK